MFVVKRFKNNRILNEMSENIRSNNEYDKMPDYIESLFSVFKMVHKKGADQKDKRLEMIALTIYNYTRYMATQYKVDLSSLPDPEMINLIPIFEYVATKNIELYDFTKIDIADVDVKKKEDLEKFVLSHIYYITQKGVK
jgi:hypothetical protein